MSMPNLTSNNIMQQQNIVINQVPHAIMTNVNANNGIPIQNPQAVDQSADHKAGIPMDTMPPAGASVMSVHPSTPTKTMHTMHTSSGPSNSSDTTQILTKVRMSDMVRDIDPNMYLEDDVEEILLNYVDDFVDRVLNGASKIAKHRHNNSIEVKDVQQFLNRNYNMWVPGFGTDELRPYKRSLTTESQKQRLALIRKALKKY